MLKRRKTLKQLKDELEKLRIPRPRTYVLNTKVVPDKTKYRRKKKHRRHDD